MSRRSMCGLLFALAMAVLFGATRAGVTDGDRYINPYALDHVLAGPLKDGVARPGQVFKVGNHINPPSGQPDGDACAPQSGGRHSKITVWSISGGTVDIPENVEHYGCFPQQTLSKLPFVIEYHNVYGSQFEIFVKAGGLDKKGRAKDLVVDFTAELADDRGEPSLSRSGQIVVPVVGVPDVTVTTRVDSLHTGELRPGGSAKFVYTVDAAGSTMDGLQFVARVPKGTKLTAGSIYPPDGVQRGTDILWTAPQTKQFVCAITVDVDKRPKTRNAVAKYLAQAKVLSYSRRTVGNKTVPIKGFADGRIQYAGASGINGEVSVGEQVFYIVSDWEQEGGPIEVTLNDERVATVTAAQPYGYLTVPPFRDGDIEHVLSARQTGNSVDLPMPGRLAGVVEIASGKAQILNDDGTVARTLAADGKIAAGEVTVTGDFATATMFGHLRVAGATSAVMISFVPDVNVPPDTRLILARGGDVRISGVVRAATIRLKAGKKSFAMNYVPADVSPYSPASKPGVVTFSSPTPTTPTTIFSNYYLMKYPSWSFNGDLTMQGSVFFAEQGGTFAGALTGTGDVFVEGDLALLGKVVIQGVDTGPFSVEGALTIGK